MKERTDYEMKILVTGFDPFGGEPVNPAIETVKLSSWKFRRSAINPCG